MATHNAATFLPGDIILLSDKGGNFTSGLTPPSNGSSGSGNVITYSNVPGETPTISGTVATISTNTRSYLTIENIVINSQTTNDFAAAINIGAADNLIFNNMTVTMPTRGYLVMSSATATNITVDGLIGNGALKQTIYFYGASNQNIQIKNATLTGGDSIRLRNIAGITIQNVTHHSSTANARLWIDNASSGVLHVDNYVTDLAGGSGLYIDGSNFDTGSYIQNSTISNVTQAFYLNNSSGILFQDNLGHNSTYGYFVIGSSHDISFLSNTATSNTLDGFQIGGTAYNITLTSNTANLNGAAKAFRILGAGN